MGKWVISRIIVRKKPGSVTPLIHNLSKALVIDLSHDFINNPPMTPHGGIHAFVEEAPYYS